MLMISFVHRCLPTQGVGVLQQLDSVDVILPDARSTRPHMLVETQDYILEHHIANHQENPHHNPLIEWVLETVEDRHLKNAKHDRQLCKRLGGVLHLKQVAES